MSNKIRNPKDMKTLNQTIFREYDIRGKYPEDLNPSSIRSIAFSIAKKCKAESIDSLVIGRDGRLSGPELIKILEAELNNNGISTENIGVVTSPLLYFAAKKSATLSGIMLTGSHNPKNYNGIKMVINDQPISGKEIYEGISSEPSSFNQNQVARKNLNVVETYVNEIVNSFSSIHKKIVVDCGNGAAGEIAPYLFKKIGCEVIELFCEIDGNFPNHHPDPGKKENLQDLIMTVKKTNADLGIAFDGDGDRLGVVTTKGKIIYPDQLMMIFAEDILEKNKRGTIIFDVKCSDHLPKIIEANHGSPIMSPTGHFHIKKKIKEHNALLGGEMSGHIFFNDTWYGFDDGLYSAIRLLDILNRQNMDLDKMAAKLPKSFATEELNIDVKEEEKFMIIEKFIKEQSLSKIFNTLDGIRLSFDNGWALLRASNTTPKLVLRFEANSQNQLETIQKDFLGELKKIIPSLNINLK